MYEIAVTITASLGMFSLVIALIIIIDWVDEVWRKSNE